MGVYVGTEPYQEGCVLEILRESLPQKMYSFWPLLPETAWRLELGLSMPRSHLAIVRLGGAVKIL
jgi:hypothetical protein